MARCCVRAEQRRVCCQGCVRAKRRHQGRVKGVCVVSRLSKRRVRYVMAAQKRMCCVRAEYRHVLCVGRCKRARVS